MSDNRVRRVHFYRDNAGKAFKNGAPGKVADTLCEANYRAKGLLTTTTPSDVSCSNCLRRLAARASETVAKPVADSGNHAPKVLTSLRNSLLDPIVLAAAVAFGASVASALLNLDRSFDHDQNRCSRAFTFLQDEAINPKLETNDEFYRSQLAIAQRCNLAKD